MDQSKMNSIGCVEYGNNCIYEVMVDGQGNVGLFSHDDFDSIPISVEQYLAEISDRPDYIELKEDLDYCLAKI